MDSTTTLNLWKQHLGRVPKSLWDRPEIETLILADNDLTEISESIDRLQSLKTLDLGHNLLASLPNNLGHIPGLRDFLYLHDNHLAALPPSLANLKDLRYLNISENRFTEFPESIAGMTGLLELRATDNSIAYLPASIERLTRLRELHLRNNQLTALPEAIVGLKELRQLDLRGNPIEYLPEALTLLPRLEKIDLRWVSTLRSSAVLAKLEASGCIVYR